MRTHLKFTLVFSIWLALPAAPTHATANSIWDHCRWKFGREITQVRTNPYRTQMFEVISLKEIFSDEQYKIFQNHTRLVKNWELLEQLKDETSSWSYEDGALTVKTLLVDAGSPTQGKTSVYLETKVRRDGSIKLQFTFNGSNDSLWKHGVLNSFREAKRRFDAAVVRVEQTSESSDPHVTLELGPENNREGNARFLQSLRGHL